CYSKLQTRFEKLKRDITANLNNEYISAFMKFAKIDIDNIDKVNICEVSYSCYKYYQKIRKNSNMLSQNPELPIFLGHLKKVASYHGSLKDIVKCAHNGTYKNIFSNLELRKYDPIIF